MITSLHSNTSFSWPTSESFRFIGVKDYKLKSLFGFHLFFLYLVAAEVGSIPKLFCYLSHFQQRLRSLGPHFLFRQYWVHHNFPQMFLFHYWIFIFRTLIQIVTIFIIYLFSFHDFYHIFILFKLYWCHPLGQFFIKLLGDFCFLLKFD